MVVGVAFGRSRGASEILLPYIRRAPSTPFSLGSHVYEELCYAVVMHEQIPRYDTIAIQNVWGEPA